jgi:hypothetical protein
VCYPPGELGKTLWPCNPWKRSFNRDPSKNGLSTRFLCPSDNGGPARGRIFSRKEQLDLPREPFRKTFQRGRSIHGIEARVNHAKPGSVGFRGAQRFIELIFRPCDKPVSRPKHFRNAGILPGRISLYGPL